jgi:hypothetical protein
MMGQLLQILAGDEVAVAIPTHLRVDAARVGLSQAAVGTFDALITGSSDLR